eukprot:327583-Prorocentrum_minimum.AAC.1
MQRWSLRHLQLRWIVRVGELGVQEEAEVVTESHFCAAHHDHHFRIPTRVDPHSGLPPQHRHQPLQCDRGSPGGSGGRFKGSPGGSGGRFKGSPGGWDQVRRAAEGVTR